MSNKAYSKLLKAELIQELKSRDNKIATLQKETGLIIKKSTENSKRYEKSHEKLVQENTSLASQSHMYVTRHKSMIEREGKIREILSIFISAFESKLWIFRFVPSNTLTNILNPIVQCLKILPKSQNSEGKVEY